MSWTDWLSPKRRTSVDQRTEQFMKFYREYPFCGFTEGFSAPAKGQALLEWPKVRNFVPAPTRWYVAYDIARGYEAFWYMQAKRSKGWLV